MNDFEYIRLALNELRPGYEVDRAYALKSLSAIENRLAAARELAAALRPFLMDTVGPGEKLRAEYAIQSWDGLEEREAITSSAVCAQTIDQKTSQQRSSDLPRIKS